MMHELLVWLSEVSVTRGRRFNHVFLLHIFEGLFLPLVRIERYNGLEKETKNLNVCLRVNSTIGVKFACDIYVHVGILSLADFDVNQHKQQRGKRKNDFMFGQTAVCTQ